MEITSLHIRTFRNLEHVRLEPNLRFNVFSGQNGQGKTNLLEAVYLLAALKSFRPQKNSELIGWDHASAHLEAEIDRAGHHRHVQVGIASSGKQVKLNGMNVGASDYFGALNTVVFSPEDVGLLRGAPAERRRFLDRAIFNTRPAYLADMQAYEQVLRQRNALLKEEHVPTMLLEVYNEQLAEHGASIVAQRWAYLVHYRQWFEETFRAIFGGADAGSHAHEVATSARLRYDSGWLPPHFSEEEPRQEEVRGCLEAALAESYPVDRRRGFTTVGAHRDDLLVELRGRSAKTYASQGQARALVLALKIAEIRFFQDRFNYTPVLLLDDVSSELDQQRNAYLFEFLQGSGGQVFITTTHRDYIRLSDEVSHFQVQNGVVSAA